MSKKIISFILIVLATFTLIGCQSSILENKSSVDSVYSPIVDYSAESSYPDPASPPEGQTQQNDILQGQKIIRYVTINVETREFESFISNFNSQINNFEAYIQSSNISGNKYSSYRMRSANIVVRVPAENVDAFKIALSENGNVTESSERIENVTLSYSDTESKLKALRTEETTLLNIMAEAQNLSDIIAIQDRLTEVRYQIELCESRLRSFDDLIGYSTITLYVSEVERETVVVKESDGEKMTRMFSESWEDTQDLLRNSFIWTIGNLPRLVFIAVSVFIIAHTIYLLCTIRSRRARRLKKKAERAEAERLKASEQCSEVLPSENELQPETKE